LHDDGKQDDAPGFREKTEKIIGRKRFPALDIESKNN